ncbi:hypothetical protein V6N13_100900 [Hibiscus sabdariffa]|uniref:Uncharacterized protein n=1 Tax=Hibiscus sabdariffa TaxID=183260 RepID=A0ABR2QJR6_9ROSI
MRISDKELVALAKIADELGVDSSIFVGGIVTDIVVSVKVKAPLEPLLLQGIDPRFSLKGWVSTTPKQAELRIEGIEPGAISFSDMHKQADNSLLLGSFDPWALYNLGNFAAFSNVMQAPRLDHGTDSMLVSMMVHAEPIKEPSLMVTTIVSIAVCDPPNEIIAPQLSEPLLVAPKDLDCNAIIDAKSHDMIEIAEKTSHIVNAISIELD